MKSVIILMVAVLSNLCPAKIAGCRPDWLTLSGQPEAPGLLELEGERLPSRSNDRQNVFLVANGSRGERILRVVPTHPREPSFILKEYARPLKFEIERDGFQWLGNIIHQGPPGSFAISHAESAGPMTLKLTDVHGRPLSEVLEDHRIPENVRKKVASAYARKLNLLEETIKKAHPDQYVGRYSQLGQPTLSVNVIRGEQEPIQISVRSSQVVVTFGRTQDDFELTIVDPF